jgi:predicted DNA-binding protein (MmcQ/YjbR family)
MIGLRRLVVSGAICAFGLGLLLATPMQPAQAQTGSPVLKSEEELIKNNFEQCMKDWDPSTHMTKRDWERVCRRVATDRTKFRMQQEQSEQRMKAK